MNKKIVKISIYNSRCTPSEIMQGNGDAILDNICILADTDENLETGEYYLDAIFLIDNEGLWKHIQEESILKVQMDYGEEYFRISKVQSTSRDITVFARQETIYQTLHMWLTDVRPENQNGQGALSHIRDNSTGPKNIKVSSDISTISTAYYQDMNMYKALHDCDQSFMNRWGGEIQRRGYNLTINKRIGTHRGVQIRSRKNLTGFEANVDIDNVFTRIKPVGYDGITIDGFVTSPLILNYPLSKTTTIKYDDVKVKDPEQEDSEGFNTLQEAQTELIRLSELEFSQNNIDKIKASYRINFVQLEQTEEYKNYVAAERVFLGDEVDVYEETLDVSITVRALRRKYDVLRQRVIEVELSNEAEQNKPPTIGDIINSLDKIEEDIKDNNNWYKDAINNATDLIQNGLKDSYVVVRKNEILVMDSTDINTAVNVWRFNRGGLGFSSTGYYGTYETAITMDGSIVGKFITGLIVNGNEINAKNLNVYNASGLKTLEVTNNGDVNLNVNNLQIRSEGVATSTQVQQKVDSVELKFSQSGGYNLLSNSGFRTGDLTNWANSTYNSPVGDWSIRSATDDWGFPDKSVNTVELRLSNQTNKEYGIVQRINTTKGKEYTVTFYYAGHRCSLANLIIRNQNGGWSRNRYFNPSGYGGNASVTNWNQMVFTFTATDDYHSVDIVFNEAQDNGVMWIAKPMVSEGNVARAYTPAPSEIYDGITTIDKNGITVTSSNVASKTTMKADGFKIIKTDNGQEVFKVNSDGTLGLIGEMTCYSGIAKSGYLGNNILKFYNWPNNTNDEIAWVYGGLQQSSGLKTLDLIGLNMVNIGTQGPGVAGASGIQVIATEVDIFKDMDFNNRKIKNLDSINEGAESSDLWINKIYLRTNQVNSAMDSGYLNLNYWRGGGATTSIVRVADGNNTGDRGTLQCGDFKAYGTKNACVETSVGYVGINAYETAEYYFGDIGESILDSEGYSYIYIDSIFKETINTNHKYQVFLSIYGEGTANVIERNPNYFVIKGTPNLEVGYEIKGKRKGYEDYRLERDYNSFVKGQEHGLDIDFLAEREKFDKELEQAALNFSLTNENLEMVVSQYVEMYINNEELIKKIEEGVILNESIN